MKFAVWLTLVFLWMIFSSALAGGFFSAARSEGVRLVTAALMFLVVFFLWPVLPFAVLIVLGLRRLWRRGGFRFQRRYAAL